MVQRTLSAARDGVPPYLAGTLNDFLTNGRAWPNQPQLGAAAALTAAMSVRAIVALVAGESIRVAPAVNHVDLRTALEPAPVNVQRPLSDGGNRASAIQRCWSLSPGMAQLFERTRPSGLKIRAVQHGDLTSEMRAALTAFRLDQYALHGLYQAAVLAERGAAPVDPSLIALRRMRLMCSA